LLARIFTRVLATALAASAAWIVSPPTAWAQAWPSRPITVLVGFPPGGNIDAVARAIAPSLAEQLGQPVVIDNKPGAGGTIASAQLARAAADGHTLAILSLGHASSASLYAKLPYHPVNDFKAVALLVNNPFVISTPAASPFLSVGELVNAARQKPGQIDYGTAGVGTGMHLVAELFQTRAGVKLNHIPYKGGSNVQVALLANEVPVVFSTPAVAGPLLAAGKIRVLAVTSRERFPTLPGVPTLAEAGYADLEVNDFLLLVAPKDTPDTQISRLHSATAQALSKPEVRAQLVKLGTVPPPSLSPVGAQQLLAGEVERWRKVIHDAGIPVGNP